MKNPQLERWMRRKILVPMDGSRGSTLTFSFGDLGKPEAVSHTNSTERA